MEQNCLGRKSASLSALQINADQDPGHHDVVPQAAEHAPDLALPRHVVHAHPNDQPHDPLAAPDHHHWLNGTPRVQNPTSPQHKRMETLRPDHAPQAQ